jgi:hypothetical protein
LIDKENESVNEEYLELQDEEIDQLKQRVRALSNNSKKLGDHNERIARQLKSHRDNFNKLFDTIMADVIFLRDSDEILVNEIEDYNDPIRKIISIKTDHEFKGKKIKTLDKWWEIHFNTGQKDDGRLYFRREKNKLQILVSFKKKQAHDIQFLSKC